MIDNSTINLYGLPSIYVDEQVVTGLLTGESNLWTKNKDLGYLHTINVKINQTYFRWQKDKRSWKSIEYCNHILDESNDIIDTLIGKPNKPIL